MTNLHTCSKWNKKSNTDELKNKKKQSSVIVEHASRVLRKAIQTAKISPQQLAKVHFWALA